MLIHQKHLIDKENSALLIIDVQEKLMPQIHTHQKVVNNCCWLINLAREFQVPVLVSEQYPKGLGPSQKEIKALIKPDETMNKVHFSCLDDSNCLKRVQMISREQFILAGIETHVCVLQTAIGLLKQGKQVFVVADACGSRNTEDADLGIERMRQLGIVMVTREMVFFEWCHQAGTEQFRRLNKAYLVGPEKGHFSN